MDKRRMRSGWSDITNIVILQHLHCRPTDKKKGESNETRERKKEGWKKKNVKKNQNEKKVAKSYECMMSSNASVASVPA